MHSYNILEKGIPLNQAKKALILLHGRGATADGIIGLANHFCDDTFYIAAPQATNQTWYPYSFLAPEDQNQPWLSASISYVQRVLSETAESIPTQNIYIMGFSQGACLALEVVARNAMQYAGIAAFTGGLIGNKVDKNKYKGHFHGTPVFIGNSDTDPHVPLDRSKQSKIILDQMGAKVTLKVYPGMSHIIHQEEILSVKDLMFTNNQ